MSTPDELQRVDIDAMVHSTARLNGGVFDSKSIKSLTRDIYYVLRIHGVDLRNIMMMVEDTITRLNYTITIGSKLLKKLESELEE